MTLLTLGGATTLDNSSTVEITANIGGSLLVQDDASTAPGTQANVVVDSLAGIATTLTVQNGATLTLGSGLSISALDTFNIGNSGTLVLDPGLSLSLGSQIDFTAGSGTLVIGAGGSISLLSPLNNYSATDTIDFAGVNVTSTNITTGLFGARTLHVMAGTTEVGSFSLGASSTVGSHPVLQSDGHGGTDVVACFLRGTRIATPRGEMAVECLQVGERVMTADGRVRRIKWIGRRSYDLARGGDARPVAPIRIAAGALADGLPHRDLLVSPKHAFFFDGVLIPAEALLNKRTVTRCYAQTEIDYIHIELDTPDLILAEGVPTESYEDCGNRWMFHNFDEDEAAHGLPLKSPYPRLEDGFIVQSVRDRLGERTGHTLGAADHPGSLLGHVEILDDDRIAGWALNENAPDQPVEIEICVAGKAVGKILANQYRYDLEDAGLAAGRCAFAITRPDMPGNIELRRAVDGVTLAVQGQ